VGGAGVLRVVAEGPKQLFSVGGVPRSLGRHAMPWRLLETLCARGQASKEELVLGIWEEQEYHPLNHTNRLRLTARKLRKLVEAEPGAPTWIVTDEDGYMLGAPTVWLRR